MSRLPLAVCALGCAFSASAQVSVREPATTARLVNNKTTISLAVTNTASQPLNVIVLLELLGPDDRRHDFARVTTVIAQGGSSLDIPCLSPISSIRCSHGFVTSFGREPTITPPFGRS